MNRKEIILLTVLICTVLFIGSRSRQAAEQDAEVALQAAIKTETVDGDLKSAIEQYKKIAALPGAGRTTVATALLRMGRCHEMLGQAEARAAYERLVRDFADQTDIVEQARARLAALEGPVRSRELVARRILEDASDIRGKLSEDGRFIREVDSDTGDVVLFEIVSGQTSRITNKGSWSETGKYSRKFTFSRDGKKIAYIAFTEDWDPLLRIRNVDGTGLRTLYREKDVVTIPGDWSPDGRSILALRGQNKQIERNKTFELVLISTANGSVRSLRNIETSYFFVYNARFSSNGRFIALNFVREGNPSHGDVFLMTADGRDETVVAGHPAEDFLLGWAPDGESLVLLSDRSGTWDLWNVPVAGGKQQGEPQLLKKNFGYDVAVLGFTPDGSCYYASLTWSGGLYEGEIDLDSGKVLVPPNRILTRYTGLPSMPTWSPDGRNLIYLSNRGNIGPGNNILTIRSAATGEERFLAPRLRFMNMITWSPDGRSVLAIGLTEKEGGLFRIDTETSGITKLRDEGFVPRLCPDGKTLVFIEGRPIIKKRNLETGEESEVAKAGNARYDLSPDGRQVVFQIDRAVKIVSLDGGEPRELIRDLAEMYGLLWTRDGRHIIVQTLFVPKSEIWRVPVNGEPPLKLDLAISNLLSFALHPDNRRFVFSVNKGEKSELWVLENLLPPSKARK
jgi:Tol biopolymer transport system component